jgi:hypothetical protein
MAEPATNVSTLTAKLKPAQCYIAGLIAARRRLQTQSGVIWLTVIKLPAQDEFSHPGTVEVRSHNPIGDVNDKWSGVVAVSGFPRSYNTKPDPETGEVKSVKTAQVQLDVVES